jgi:hypothetical protein
MPLRGRVGRHTRLGGRQCQNWADDQQTIIALLKSIPVSQGGAGGNITGRVISGFSSDALYKAISRFEDKHFPGQRNGFVDPGGAMLKLMEDLSSGKPVVILPPAPPSAKTTVFTRGDMHNHQPTGRWEEIQANPNSRLPFLTTVTKLGSPAEVITAASVYSMRDKPLAREHLQWFVSKGGGRDFVEDKNLELMLKTDAKVQAKILSQFPKGQSSGTFSSHLAITQDDYADEDFQYAFGEIDRLDLEVDFTAGSLHAWFMDRYEWHPYYPSIYPKQDGDYLRDTNAVHAAAVEMKAGAARDFWMKGEVTIPLKAIQSTADKPVDPWDDPPKPIY